MRWPILAALCVAVGAQAQVFNPPDISSAVRSALPPTCTAPPAMDTYGGTAGTMDPCVHRADAAPATVVQARKTVTAVDGSWSVTWAQQFDSAGPTVVFASVVSPSTAYICQTATMSATGASGRCFQVVSTTLPGALTGLLGLTVSPLANPAANLPVMVVGRQ